MLQAINLHKTFGQVEAVKSVSFKAEKGEIVGLLGVNGAGKSTTIKMLTTYLSPSSGAAKVAGYDLIKEAAKVRGCIGYLPELPALYPELTVYEHLKFFSELRILDRTNRRGRIEEVLASCSLQSVSGIVAKNLSRGFRQRLGFAIAILHDPAVLILDEPSSGLDPKQVTEMRSLIGKLGAQKTVLLSTHLLSEVSQICSRVVMISEGMVKLDSRLKEIGDDRALEQAFLTIVADAEAGEIRKLASGVR